MDNFYLNEIVAEVAPVIIGRRLTRATLHGGEQGVDLRLEFGGPRAILVTRLSGSDPALYLASAVTGRNAGRSAQAQTERNASSSGQQLLLQIRSKLVGCGVTSIEKDVCDRVVRITLCAPDWHEATGADLTLILILTGRSVNAVLVGQSGLIEAAFKETGPIQIGARPPLPRSIDFDPDLALRNTKQELTSDEILKSYFGRSSTFSNLYTQEFLARVGSRSPSLGFRGLLEDLFRNKRSPIIYSAVPLEKVAAGAINSGREPLWRAATRRRSAPLGGSIVKAPASGSEIILSCIDLTLAASWLRYDFASFSEAAETYSETIAQATALRARYARLARGLEGRLRKLRAALGSIQSDLARFGESEKLKRFGDLLLANLTTARVESGIAWVKDYYESGEPEIEIKIEEDQTLQQAATAYYERYQKARRAVKTLVPRAREISGQIARNEQLLDSLGQQPDLQRIEEIEARSGLRADPQSGYHTQARGGGTGRQQTGPDRSRRVEGPMARSRGSAVRGRVSEIGRRFLSSDGLEIVVGRNDSENDAITFRVAGSLDVWLHAADYPGSHVVIRNPSRRAVPQRSIGEAARIAAFYSQARGQGKAAVNYTQKRFVTKPPKSKPGLVRLSSYKTVLVEPGIPAGLDRGSQEP